MTSNPAKKYCSDACRMRAFQARVVASRHGHGHCQRSGADTAASELEPVTPRKLADS